MSELGTRATAAHAPVTAAVAGTADIVDTAGGVTTRQRSMPRLVLTRFLRHRLAVGALIVLLLVVGFAFIGPLLWTYDHTIGGGHGVGSIPTDQPPSWGHPFGTTRSGHDYLGQIMRGTQQTIKVGFVVCLLATTFGAVWGAVAGYYRGWVDTVMMRVVDIIFVVPLLVVALVLAGMTQGTTWVHVALILSAFSWLVTSRLVRGEVMVLREQEYIEAARAAGASDTRIIARHLIPNTVSILIVAATLQVATAVLAEAALSFLGFGITLPDTSLGLLINQAQTAVFTRPWLFYLPGALIVVICLAINFIGDGLRDAFDPKQTMVRR